MKNLLIVFGVLDLVNFYRIYQLIPTIYNRIGELSVFSLISVLTTAWLLVVGILSILKKKSGIYAYYIQLPFRFLFASLTFSFLAFIFKPSYPSISFYIISISIVLLEIARLVLTIIIHKRYFLKKVAE